jgi:type I restriction enzyme S subunit
MKQYKVKDVFDVLSGSTPSTCKPEYSNGAVKWITPKDLSGLQSATIEETERRITTAGFDSCSAQLIPTGSIIISSRAPIGYVAVLEDDMSCNQGLQSSCSERKS